MYHTLEVKYSMGSWIGPLTRKHMGNQMYKSQDRNGNMKN